MPAADALNPKQHKDFVYTHDHDPGTGGAKFDDYKLIRRTATEAGDLTHEQVGHLTVDRYPGRSESFVDRAGPAGYQYDASWYAGGTNTSVPVTQRVTATDPDYGHSYTFDKRVGRQGRLFEYQPPEAPEHKVDLLAGTKEHRAANTVLLGMAENNARAEGTTLLPSEDLSEHS